MNGNRDLAYTFHIYFADCTDAEATEQNCMNGGTCQKLDWGDGTFDFFCHCAKGFSGWHCQFEDDGKSVFYWLQ